VGLWEQKKILPGAFQRECLRLELPVFMREKSTFLAGCLALLFGCVAAKAAELKPERWEKEIAAFETADRRQPPPQGGILFVGSSSIRYWTNLSSDFPEWNVLNRGFGGSHVPDTTHFAERIIFPYEPSKIVLYAGDNDIARGRSPSQVLEDFKNLVGKVHARLPKTKIYFLAIKPSPSRWYLSPQAREANQLVRRYARFRSKVEFIDIWSPLIKEGRPSPALYERDRLHINRKGYELWIPVIRRALHD
jgi:lysophospholipase L1-like esterase